MDIVKTRFLTDKQFPFLMDNYHVRHKVKVQSETVVFVAVNL